MIIGTYSHSQNVEKHKKDKIVTLSFPKIVNFYHFSVPELRISENVFAILLTKILTDRKQVFIFIKNKKDKKTNNWDSFLSRKITFPWLLVNNYGLSGIEKLTTRSNTDLQCMN